MIFPSESKVVIFFGMGYLWSLWGLIIEIVQHCYVSELLVLLDFLDSPPTSHHRSPPRSFSKENSLWCPDSFQLKLFMWKPSENDFFWPNQEPGPFWKDLPLGPLGVRLWWLQTIALLVSSYFGCLGMFPQQETNPPNIFWHFGVLIRFN